MNELLAALQRWLDKVTFWIVVAPWEQAIRVRCGRHVRRLDAGVHFRLPLVDTVYRQSVRLRMAQIPIQTLSTSDGATLVIGAAIGYAIRDIEALYTSLHHAEDTLANATAAAIAKQVYASKRADVTASCVSAAATEALRPQCEQFGLSDVEVRITDFAFVRTYRLVQEGRWFTHQDYLSTKDAAL